MAGSGQRKSVIDSIKSLFEPEVQAALSREERRRKRREIVESFKAKSDRNRSWAEKISDQVAGIFGSFEFVVLHIVWFVVWVAWNTGLIPGVQEFDPYPFGLLTMIVSLEAIFLSSIVLLSQNRSAKVADLREDVDLSINVQTEYEVTKLLNLVDEIHQHLGLKKHQDKELEQLKKRTNVEKIEASIVEQTAEAANGETTS